MANPFNVGDIIATKDGFEYVVTALDGDSAVAVKNPITNHSYPGSHLNEIFTIVKPANLYTDEDWL